MISIELMRENDIDGVLDVEHHSFSIPWSRKSFEDELKNEHTVYLTAKDGKKVIGYAGIWCVFGEGSITNIAVSPEYRGTGIGSMLLKEIISEAKKKDTKSIVLEVRKSNAIAQGLYKKFGFEIIGERKAYYSDNGENALLMERNET